MLMTYALSRMINFTRKGGIQKNVKEVRASFKLKDPYSVVVTTSAGSYEAIGRQNRKGG